MAMDGDTMGLLIIAEIEALGDDRSDRTEVFKAIGRAIVSHIVNFAEVDVDHVTGVTVGAGNSGPGTGTVS